MPRAAETILLTLLALIAFASNSILNRLALAAGLADAASFTLVRLVSGALVLAALVRVRHGDWSSAGERDLIGPLSLFSYAAAFSFAYLRLGAAVGALVLFGTVQLTMIGWAVGRGRERPTLRVWAGLLLAAGGLWALLLPSANRPDPFGLVLMAWAGVSWGAYSLHGRTVVDPLRATARNFVRTVPLAVLLSLASWSAFHLTPGGALLAVLSGALASGLGYAIWYRALRGLRATQAGVVQLSVPVLAAFAAVGLLGEAWNVRLIGCGAAVLGGVAVVLSEKWRSA